MFSQETPDQIILKQEKQIQELEIRLNTLQKHMDQLYREVGVTPEQLDAAFQKSENFTPEEWKMVQIQEKQIQAQIDQAANKGAKPADTAKTRHQQRELERHWIFVR